MTIYSEAALSEIGERVAALEILYGHTGSARATYLGSYSHKTGEWSGESVAEIRAIIQKLSEPPPPSASTALCDAARELKRAAERLNVA